MIGCVGEALDESIVPDLEELEDARWFEREEVRLMLERRHPGEILTPPPMAIANFLMRSFIGK
jgi:NAD+ diphosphatase